MWDARFMVEAWRSRHNFKPRYIMECADIYYLWCWIKKVWRGRVCDHNARLFRLRIFVESKST